ncbi:hypothetical protein QTG54_015608 [Skeletonema marinoi]|uniref:Uncharacterized protein n=1 Tax=Skeletonema marinoi TaxID=267567 RepID=A0AAD9D5K1_9STRA|nr:hypothetical protein QTG54_015608 [Skeletonema marinoi]
MDKDTFIAIRALHHAAAFDFKFVDHGGYSSQEEEERHYPSIESTYDAYDAIEYVDVDVGGDSQQEEEDHPSMESNYHDAYHVDVGGESEEEDRHHPSTESTFDAYYATMVDVDVGGDLQQEDHHPSIESNYHDMASSSSSYNDIKYRIEASSADLHLQRLVTATPSSSCTLSDKNAVLIAAILIMVVYPLIGTRLRSKLWGKRRTRLTLSEDLEEEGRATSSAHAQDMLERGLHR